MSAFSRESCLALLEKYKAVVGSPRNQENKNFWENADEPYLVERWRGRSKARTHTPVTIALDISGYAQVLDINCRDYYSKPDAHLHEQLRYALWEAEHLDCNRYFEYTVFDSFGSVFEAAMFGAKIHFLPGQAPWYDEQTPVFEDKKALLSVKPFDFRTSGLCGLALENYQKIQELTAGSGVKVMYPITMRSPFSIAIMLRGFENLLIDIYDDPGFFKELMALITSYIKQYMAARAAFLKEPVPTCMLFNDEISTPIISPAMYEEFILPYEIELSEFCGGIRYWHSCGNTSAFYPLVASIPNLKMMHIGPWSTKADAAEIFGEKDIPLDICVNSVEDVYQKTAEEMREHLTAIRDACNNKVRFAVRADGLAVLSTAEEAMRKIKEWSEVAKEVFEPDASRL